jgi:hypothetical protein
VLVVAKGQSVMSLDKNNEKKKTEIRITPKMIEAGAEILWKDTLFDISESLAEELTAKIIRRALKVRR